MLKETTQDLWTEQSRSVQQTIAYIREKNLFQSGDRVLVAVSGGLDSSVLLHILARAARILSVEIEAAHVDHSTRAEASAREAVWVGVLAERLHVKMHKLSVSAETGGQLALRKKRREALEELAKSRGCRIIATAHHANDNSETFLMRAMSGAGVRGLSGMNPKTQNWVKPLLWAARKDLETYARECQLSWVEDPSNKKSDYLRNSIRNKLLPDLEQIRQGAIGNLAKAASRIQEEEQEWDEWLEMQMTGPVETLSLSWLERWPRPLQRRIVRFWVTQRLGLSDSSALTEALLKGEDLIHPAGSFLRRSDMLVFSAEEDFSSAWQEGLSVDFARRQFLGRSMAWSFLPSSPVRGEALSLSLMCSFYRPGQRLNPGTLLLSWAKTRFPLHLRCITKQESAKFAPLFKHARIPKPYWNRWPVLCESASDSEVEGALVALVGLKALESYAAAEKERAVAISHFCEENLKP